MSAFLGIIQWMNTYVNLLWLIVGLVILGVGIGLAHVSNDHFDTSKLGARAASYILIAIGLLVFLQSIVLIGFEQALAITFIFLFVGAFWLMAARGFIATIVGIVLAIIFYIVAAGYTHDHLPPTSFVRQFVDIFGGAGAAIYNGVTSYIHG